MLLKVKLDLLQKSKMAENKMVDASKFITTMKATSTPEVAEIWGRIG